MPPVFSLFFLTSWLLLSAVTSYVSVGLSGETTISKLSVTSVTASTVILKNSTVVESCTLGQISYTEARGHVFCSDIDGTPTWLSLFDITENVESAKYTCPGSEERPVFRCAEVPNECQRGATYFVNTTSASSYIKGCDATLGMEDLDISLSGLTTPLPTFVSRTDGLKVTFPDSNPTQAAVTVTAPFSFSAVSASVTISLIPGGVDHPDFTCETVVVDPVTWTTGRCATPTGTFAFGIPGENLLPFENIGNFLSTTSLSTKTWEVSNTYSTPQDKIYFISEQIGGGDLEKFDLVLEITFSPSL